MYCFSAEAGAAILGSGDLGTRLGAAFFLQAATMRKIGVETRASSAA